MSDIQLHGLWKIVLSFNVLLRQKEKKLSCHQGLSLGLKTQLGPSAFSPLWHKPCFSAASDPFASVSFIYMLI